MTDNITGPDPDKAAYRFRINAQVKRWKGLRPRWVDAMGEQSALEVDAEMERTVDPNELDDATHAADLAEFLEGTLDKMEHALGTRDQFQQNQARQKAAWRTGARIERPNTADPIPVRDPPPMPVQYHSPHGAGPAQAPPSPPLYLESNPKNAPAELPFPPPPSVQRIRDAMRDRREALHSGNLPSGDEAMRRVVANTKANQGMGLQSTGLRATVPVQTDYDGTGDETPEEMAERAAKAQAIANGFNTRTELEQFLRALLRRAGLHDAEVAVAATVVSVGRGRGRDSTNLGEIPLPPCIRKLLKGPS